MLVTSPEIASAMGSANPTTVISYENWCEECGCFWMGSETENPIILSYDILNGRFSEVEYGAYTQISRDGD